MTPPVGKSGPRDVLHQLGRVGRRPLQQEQAGVDQLGGVVRRDGGGHAHGDAGGAVGQQVGEAGRQDHRLFVLAVVGGAEIDRVLVDAVEQQLGGLGQAALGVAHGRGVIAVDVAEVALAVDQRIALGEVLGQADQGVIDRDVAVRVVLADHVADHPGRLLGRGLRIEPQQAHGVEQSPVHRLEAVAHVRQGALGDGRQGIGEIAPRQRLAQRFIEDAAAVVAGGGVTCSFIPAVRVRVTAPCPAEARRETP